MWSPNDVREQNMEYLCANTKSTGLMSSKNYPHCDSGYDVTRATYSFPDLYLPKMKNALNLLLVSLMDFLLLVRCNARISSHPLNEHQEQLTLLEGGKLWFYPLKGESLELIVLPWKCHRGHIVELCDECNNCTKFQNSAEIFHFL